MLFPIEDSISIGTPAEGFDRIDHSKQYRSSVGIFIKFGGGAKYPLFRHLSDTQGSLKFDIFTWDFQKYKREKLWLQV